jgi:hypothetical protein
MKPNGFPKQLENGLQWTDVKSNYISAMFVVPTPTVDDSGVAHLCEHLVFRTSKSYPEAHNLFACTTLTACKINASSRNNESLFYATAPDSSTLAKLINYLYAGLQNLEYSEMALAQERDGVIFQELSYLESQPEYQNMIRMWRDDSRLHKYYHWGGYTDTVPHITVNDVISYKTQFYRPELINLYTSGISEDLILRSLEDIESIDAFVESKKVTATEPNFTPVSDTYYPKLYNYQRSHVQLLSWWLPKELHSLCLDNLQRWRKQFPDLWVEEHLNQNQKFAIRTTSSDWESLGQMLSDTIQDECSMLFTTQQIDNKHPLAIQTLLAEKDEQEATQTSFFQSLAAYKIFTKQPSQSSLGNLPRFKEPRVPSQHEASSKASLLDAWPYPLTLEYATAPKHITNLLQDAHQHHSDSLLQVPFVRQQDWIMQLNKPEEDICHKLLESKFWQPRILGDCYAMGIFSQDHKVYIWGVSDKRVEQRGQWLSSIFN